MEHLLRVRRDMGGEDSTDGGMEEKAITESSADGGAGGEDTAVNKVKNAVMGEIDKCKFKHLNLKLQ